MEFGISLSCSSFPCLRLALLFDNQSELRYFLKRATISLCPPPPSPANSQSGPGEIQMHKATGEAGPVLSTPSFLVTGAATMHYPAVIDRVGLCRPGSWARLRWGPGALAPFHATCREQGKLRGIATSALVRKFTSVPTA